jgi:hypothetical protein
MRQPARRVPLPDVADPFAEDCCVRQSVAPKSPRDSGPVRYELEDCSMRNEAEDAITQGGYVVVQDMKEQALQVRNVAGLVKRQNLAMTVANYLRSQDKAIDHEAACRRPVSDRDDWFSASHSFHRDRQPTDGRLVLVIDLGADPQPLQEGLDNVHVIHRSLAHS